MGAGILSLDSRAGEIVARWTRESAADAALTRTGQVPHVSAPSALLAWVKHNDPERFDQIGSVLACKDWLRLCLTGVVCADRTEASASFTDVRTQTYSPDALAIYGLEALADALPPIHAPAEVVGHVSAEAASVTGLCEGTPVVAGLHDVTASALGVGGHELGVLAIVAGTYSINEVFSEAPRNDRRWFCRNAVESGQWNNMAISPASTANCDWFLDTFCRREQEAATAGSPSIHEIVASEIDAAPKRRSTLLFHPFLFGSAHGDLARGAASCRGTGWLRARPRCVRCPRSIRPSWRSAAITTPR